MYAHKIDLIREREELQNALKTLQQKQEKLEREETKLEFVFKVEHTKFS